MKKLVITLSVIAMLGMISPGLPTLAQPTRIPHENPATATSSPDSVALLLSYSQIIRLATSRQYQNAQDVLNELKLAEIPDELRYITDRHSSLYQQLFTNLDNLESLLDEASTLLAHNQIHEAKQMLADAEADIQDTGALLEDIEAATDTLSNKLDVFAGPAASPLGQAHTRLEESLEQLRGRHDKLRNLQHSLSDRHVQISGLTPTELSLSTTPASVFVGETITASGRLSRRGKPLAGRKLAFILDDESIATNNTITTRIDGSYFTSITIPYKYAETMTLNTVYEPSGDDTDEYLGSYSPPITINTMFHTTLLEVSAPEIVHPGLPFTISGQISSSGDNTDRTVIVLLDDTRLAEETVPGQFNLEVEPPEQVSTGKHNLTVSVSPQQRHAGAAETRTINISRLPVHIDTQTPNLVILPGAIRVSGDVYYEFGPLPDARVILKLKNFSSTSRTSPDGKFTDAIKLPVLPESVPLSANPFYVSTPARGSSFEPSLIRSQEIIITIEPLEPWCTPLQIKRQVLTINPLITGLTLVFLAALGLLIYRRSKTRMYEGSGVPQAEIMELPAITPPPEPRPILTGIKGRILSAYRVGLEAVETISGIFMAPNVTLREFLKTVTLLPPTAIGQFAELTAIAESALYSDYRPHEDTATRAEQLAINIKEELHSGTP
jgi:hypothetical protein